MSRFVASFVNDVRGATSIEYCASALLISVSALIAFTQINPSLKGFYDLIGVAFPH